MDDRVFDDAFLLATVFFAAGFAAAVAWLVCFARARDGRLGAASAGALNANEATSATRIPIAVLRIIERSSNMRLR